MSLLAIQASGKVVEFEQLRKDKSYLNLHVHIAKVTKQIILKLQDDSKMEKKDPFVYFPVSHRSENRPFPNLNIFNTNSK